MDIWTMEWLTKESFYTYNQVPKYEKLTEELKQITYFYNYERKQEQLGWQALLNMKTI